MSDISHDIGPFPLTGSSELYPLSVCIRPTSNVFTCCAVSKQLHSFIIDPFLFKKISDPMFLYLQLQFRMLRVQFGIFFYTGCNSGYTITGYIKINNNIPVSQDKWIYGQDIIHIIEVYIKPGKYVVYQSIGYAFFKDFSRRFWKCSDNVIRVDRSFLFCVMFCGTLLVLLFLCFRSLSCMFCL